MLTALLLWTLTAQSAATAPATQDAPPAVEEVLYDGRIHLTPPAGWSARRSPDGMSVQYTSPDYHGLIGVVVTSEDVVPDEDVQASLGRRIVRKARADADAAHVTFDYGPKIERDDRFFLKVHDRFHHGDVTGDREQIYRVMGLSMVTVVSVAQPATPEQAALVHETAERMLDAATLTHGYAHAKGSPAAPGTPVDLPQAHLQFTPPPGWTVETHDIAGATTSAPLATLRDPKEPVRLIQITVHALPPEALNNMTVRDQQLDLICVEERESIRVSDGASLDTKPVEFNQRVSDDRFLRKVRTRADVESTPGLPMVPTDHVRIGTRLIAAGDAVICVTSIAPPSLDSETDSLADAVAISLRPESRHKP